MKNFFLSIGRGIKFVGRWFDGQIEWVKSFLNDRDLAGKGSSKSIGSLAMIGTFIFTYSKVSIVKQSMADITPTWAILIAGILGLNILDKLLALYINKSIDPNKMNPEQTKDVKIAEAQ